MIYLWSEMNLPPILDPPSYKILSSWVRGWAEAVGFELDANVMTHLIERLTALKVARIATPGFYADGAGLYLQVKTSSAGAVTKSWVFRFMLRGRAREMGLGSLKTFGLADAREKAKECRRQLYEGIDPIEARKAAKAQARLEAAKSVTFKICAERYIATHRAAWRNEKHAKQWDATLETYV